MIKVPGSTPFHVPVTEDVAPRYFEFIERPMDLKAIKNNLKSLKYHSKESFMRDVVQIHSNCEIYNGADHVYTTIARELVRTAEAKLTKAASRIQAITDELDKISRPQKE
jgi:hypothetical protein